MRECWWICKIGQVCDFFNQTSTVSYEAWNGECKGPQDVTNWLWDWLETKGMAETRVLKKLHFACLVKIQ